MKRKTPKRRRIERATDTGSAIMRDMRLRNGGGIHRSTPTRAAQKRRAIQEHS